VTTDGVALEAAPDAPWATMPKGNWKVRRVRDVARLLNGYPFDSSGFNPEGGVRLVRIRDLAGSATPTYYRGPGESRASIGDCDVVIGMDGDFNVGTWRWGPAALNQRMCCVRAGEEVDARFLGYMLPFPLRVINDLTYFTTVKHLASSQVLDIRFACPALDRQRAIADFLDRKTAAIDELIRKKERLIELLQEKRQALITQAVTKGLDPNVPMKDSGIEWLGEIPAHWALCQLGRQITLQRGVDITKDEQNAGQVPVVSSGGISSYHDAALVDGPGVVVGRKGSAGTVHWVAEDYWPHDTTLYVKWWGGNDRRFVFYKLISMDLAGFDTGSANPTVNRNLVHRVHGPWPPLAEQRQLAGHLDAHLEKTALIMEKTSLMIERLAEYRRGLISAAVTGRLEVADG